MLQSEVGSETSASQATAASTWVPLVMAPIRAAATWKSTVGTNIATETLANRAYRRNTGGAVVIPDECNQETSSIV